ncbi:kinase-like protein [Xylaria arbuscula]|nr:kinase-like protein [Xylaria arbuscula]
MHSSPVNSGQLRSEKFKDTQRAWKRLRATLKPYEDEGEMEYDRVLGRGGFGIVQKWKTNGPKVRGRAHTVAVETILKPYRETCRFQGCEHLVQLEDLPEIIQPTITSVFNNENCTGIPIMAMEELGCGTLDLLMTHIEDVRALNSTMPDEYADIKAIEYIPNRALWGIFLCLVRGLIGIAYPPDDPDSRKGQVIRETMADVKEGRQPSTIIHSDIDIYNAFIGYPRNHEGPADSEHLWHPIVKIADYGCMIRWDNKWPENIKNASLWGKNPYKSPEQLDPDLPFGTHTNVYQIGQIMHDLITLAPLNFSDRVEAERSVTTSDGRNIQFMTYGGRLLDGPGYQIQRDWRNVDIELRELAAGCMASIGTWRPPLRQLEYLIQHHIDKQDKAALEAKQGLTPRLKVFVETDVRVDKLFERRVPAGYVEPDSLLQGFYQIYFREQWDEGDKYAEYYSKEEAPSSPSDESMQESLSRPPSPGRPASSPARRPSPRLRSNSSGGAPLVSLPSALLRAFS